MKRVNDFLNSFFEMTILLVICIIVVYPVKLLDRIVYKTILNK